MPHLPNLAPFARRGRATGQRTYCPCSVLWTGGASVAGSPRAGCGTIARQRDRESGRTAVRSPPWQVTAWWSLRTRGPSSAPSTVLTVFRLPAGGAVRQGSRSSRSRRAGTGHYLPQPS